MASSLSQRADDIIARLRASVVRTGIAPRDIFARLDVDGNGLLSCEEVLTLFVQLQGDLSSAEQRCIFHVLDKDGNGEVDINEFCAIFQEGCSTNSVARRTSRSSSKVEQRLPSPNVQSVIQRLAIAIVRVGVEPRDLFRRLDANTDRQLSADELDRLVLQFQPGLSHEEREMIFQHFDLDGSGLISSDEFSQTLACAVLDAAAGGTALEATLKSAPSRVDDMLSRLQASLTRMGLNPRDLFSRLDVNKDGQISVEELERLTLQLQPDLSRSDRRLFFERVDLDGSGLIDLREFCSIFEPNVDHQPCSIQHVQREGENRYGCQRQAGVRA